MTPRLRQTLLWAAVLFAAAFALYAPSLSFGFVEYDDFRILRSQPKLYNQESFGGSLNEIFTDLPREEPLLLRDISWALDARVFGFENAFGYHLGNVLLNAFNVALLFIFLLLATKAFRFALISAALWGVLVVHVEPVCWVMGRKGVLSTFFILAALIGHLCFLQSSKRRGLYYLVGIVCTLCALLSKISALPLFLFLALLTLFRPFLDGEQPTNASINLRAHGRNLLALLPHTILCLLVYFWYSNQLAGYALTNDPILGRGPGLLTLEHLWTLITILPIVMAMYLKYIFSPFEHPLAWDWPNASIPLSPLELTGSLLFAAAIVAVMLRLYLRRKDLFFAAAAFFVLMIPYMNIMYIGIWIANRYVYLSSACLVCILVWFGAMAYRKSSKTLRQGIVVIAAAYFVLSCVLDFQEQQKWQDERSFWQYEASLERASLLGTQNIARMNLVKIQAARPPLGMAETQRLIVQAQEALNKGVQTYESLGFVDTNYHADQHPYYAMHFCYLGGFAGLDPRNVQTQLKYYQRAVDLQPINKHALMGMGDTYRLLAAQQSGAKLRQLALQSLDYYAQFLSLNNLSHLDLQKGRQILQLFRENFSRQEYPALRRRVDELERGLRR